MTQTKVQMETGIDQSDYSKIERGIKSPTWDQGQRLALLFGTSWTTSQDSRMIRHPIPARRA